MFFSLGPQVNKPDLIRGEACCVLFHCTLFHCICWLSDRKTCCLFLVYCFNWLICILSFVILDSFELDCHVFFLFADLSSRTYVRVVLIRTTHTETSPWCHSYRLGYWNEIICSVSIYLFIYCYLYVHVFWAITLDPYYTILQLVIVCSVYSTDKYMSAFNTSI